MTRDSVDRSAQTECSRPSSALRRAERPSSGSQKSKNACWDTALAAASPVDIPTGWEPRTKQQQWVAFADFPQCSVVFAAKYRRMVIYGQIKKDIGQILRKLCEQKDIEIIEAEACPDHIHMLISFSPKYSISYVMGYLKGKSSLFSTDTRI